MGIIQSLRGLFGKGVMLFGRNLHPTGYTYLNSTIGSNETIFSAVSMLSGAIASAPISLRRDYQKLDPADHRVAELLEVGPNPNMTMFGFMQSIETLRDTTGAGYALKELDGTGRLLWLWLVKTSQVTPMIDSETRELYYWIRDDLTGQSALYHNSHVIAVRHISPDGINPINPISVLQNSLDYDKEVKEFSVDQMRNGLRSNVAIKFPKELSKEQIEEYNTVVKQFLKSGVLYLDAGKEVTSVQGGNVIDPKVFEVENITVARIARVYNIPLTKLLSDKASFSSAEQGDLAFLRDTILPMARMYEQEFSQKLLGYQERMSGLEIKLSLNGFARADMSTRGDFYQKGIRSGWFCLDDIRALEDLPPLPDGQGREHYISKDLIPVRLLPAEYNNTTGR